MRISEDQIPEHNDNEQDGNPLIACFDFGKFILADGAFFAFGIYFHSTRRAFFCTHQKSVLSTAINKKNHPKIKKRPPSGVIAPNHLMPEMLKVYNDPEKRIRPIIME